MKVVIAIDSFKGSLSTLTAGEAVAEGIKNACPDAETLIRPLADGGEGTVFALTYGRKCETVKVNVNDPLGRIIETEYCITDGNTAITEMSAAAGITLITAEDRNPMEADTYGVGEIIADAIKRGCRNFIIGIGGSATNDGGIGMLRALGVEFSDKGGNPIPRGGKGLGQIEIINTKNMLPALAECKFTIICDVTNPLCGKNGCSAIYGPQKGATVDMIWEMDGWLKAYAEKTEKLSIKANPDTPGAGAAGGLGFAFLAYTNAVLEPGINVVIKESRLEDYIKTADIVVTGEGRLDGQTAMGKAPAGVALLAKKYDKPVVAFSGCVTRDATACNTCGIDAFFPILRAPCNLEEAMNPANARQNMTDTAEQVFRLIKASVLI